jgi:hypothetical protein
MAHRNAWTMLGDMSLSIDAIYALMMLGESKPVTGATDRAGEQSAR